MPIYPYPHGATNVEMCNGPVGSSIVLPVVTTSTTSVTNNYLTSMCDGTNMHSLWMANNLLIQTVSPVVPSYTSWIYLPMPSVAPVGTYAEGVLFTPPKPRPKIVPAVIRAGRRAVRRSIDLYARFRGIEEVRRFMHGEEIEFEGELYRYRVKKTVQIIKQAINPNGPHIPYSLSAIDKATGRKLASGCVIFPALPVFDQLLALSFHIQDPEDERELIKTTNWSPRLRAPSAQSEQWVENARAPIAA